MDLSYFALSERLHPILAGYLDGNDVTYRLSMLFVQACCAVAVWFVTPSAMVSIQRAATGSISTLKQNNTNTIASKLTAGGGPVGNGTENTETINLAAVQLKSNHHHHHHQPVDETTIVQA